MISLFDFCPCFCLDFEDVHIVEECVIYFVVIGCVKVCVTVTIIKRRKRRMIVIIR